MTERGLTSLSSLVATMNEFLFQHLERAFFTTPPLWKHFTLINIFFDTTEFVSYIYIYMKIPFFHLESCSNVGHSRWIIVIRPIPFGWTTRSKEIKWDWIIERAEKRRSNEILFDRRIQTQCGESNRGDHHWPHSPLSYDQISWSKSSLIIVFILFLLKKNLWIWKKASVLERQDPEEEEEEVERERWEEWREE